MQRYGYSLTDLEDMVSWERDVYLLLLDKYIRDENDHKKVEIENLRTEREKLTKMLKP